MIFYLQKNSRLDNQPASKGEMRMSAALKELTTVLAFYLPLFWCNKHFFFKVNKNYRTAPHPKVLMDGVLFS